MKRREFLHRTGWFVVGASLVGVGVGAAGPGCSDDKKTLPPDGGPMPEAKGTYSFPQGVASGDPRENSVVLWTRAIRNSDIKDVTIRVQIAYDASYADAVVVAERLITATAASDHTVRVVVTNLAAGKAYHYRFIAGSDEIGGQTRTAPSATADVQVNLAWVSCQDYGAGHYGAYRQMIVDDDARADADKVFAVVHLGDMIYETRANDFQTAIDDSFSAIALTNPDGTPRAVPAFPTGGTRGTINFAATVDDYRLLYRTFLSDPDLQAARARWPFISIWDDHEFTDDCWQSQANYDNAHSLDETDQTRRVAASQAWFEYVPVQLTGAGGVDGVDSEAHDFKPVDVVDAAFTAPNDDNFVDEPNNAAAVGAIAIYRSLRIGKHVELVMTDERSYRSDHAIPEDISSNPAFLSPRNALPLGLVNLFDQGKTAFGGNPPATVDLGGGLVIPNVRAASPPGTMLGAKQKAWWKATMKGSDATWKLWGNEVTMMRLRITAVAAAGLPADLVISADSWDGYPTERTELMTFLKDEKIDNVVVLSGDIHASFAGLLVDDFDAATPVPVACELVGPGISSNSLLSFFLNASKGTPNQAIIVADARLAGGSQFVENLNLVLLGGTATAIGYAQTLSVPPLDPTANPHLKHADTNSQGYGYVKIGATGVDATIVTINRPIVTPAGTTGPGIKRTASFSIATGDPKTMTAPTYTGTKPFPVT